MAANEETEAQQRRKLQNRTNQRARRMRLKAAANSAPRPFKIERWRLNDDEEPPVPSTSRPHSGPLARRKKGTQGPEWALSTRHGPPMSLEDLTLMEREPLLRLAQLYLAQKHSPLQDHLLHLVQFNFLRAVFSIKFMLSSSTEFCIQGNKSGEEPQLVPIDDAHPSQATLVMATPATASNLPSSLLPTHLQCTHDHSTWIDVLPFPAMRDNLITYETNYDQVEFGHDLVGDLVDFAGVYHLQRPAKPPKPAMTPSLLRGQSGSTETRTGLIVWGEPHSPESWEVTLGFVQKWPWALAGCQRLLDSSNRWRALRGEDPLPPIE